MVVTHIITHLASFIGSKIKQKAKSYISQSEVKNPPKKNPFHFIEQNSRSDLVHFCNQSNLNLVAILPVRNRNIKKTPTKLNYNILRNTCQLIKEIDLASNGPDD